MGGQQQVLDIGAKTVERYERYIKGAGTVFMSGLILFGAAPANALGVASYPIPVPNDGTLEGIHVNFHAIEAQPGTGAIFGAFDLSDGLRVRLGDFITNCP
jgi:hypothetical protein